MIFNGKHDALNMYSIYQFLCNSSIFIIVGEREDRRTDRHANVSTKHSLALQEGVRIMPVYSN